ncbi:MAG: cupin domain-containing protein [Anaerolineae bacterium]
MKNTFFRFEENPAAGMVPSKDTPLEAFTTSDQSEKDHSYFATDDESILTGVWECAPSKLTFDSYPVHEMMTILSGSVTVTNHDDGRVETFTAGDTFFVAKGSGFTWEITETLRKYYFIAA